MVCRRRLRNLPSFVTASFESYAIRSFRVIRGEVIEAVLHKLDRTARYLGERARDADSLAQEVLAAKTAAGIHGVKVELVRRNLEHAGHHPGSRVQHIGVRPDLHSSSGRIIGADRAV